MVIEAFEPAFMQRALVASLLAVVATSLVGTASGAPTEGVASLAAGCSSSASAAAGGAASSLALVSTGAACHSGSENLSPTLAAIGLTHAQTRGTVRLSVGWDTTEEEIDRACSLLVSAWESERGA